MVNFILIAVCILTGMLFKYAKWIHPDAHKGINTWILYIALPAVSFKYLPKIHWTNELIVPVLSAALVTFGSWLFMTIYSKSKNYSARTKSTLELSSGYSNTSFIGFPLITAFYGEKMLSIAIICDQTMFFILSTLGIITALKGGNKSQAVNARFILKRLITFPPFIGCIAALSLAPIVNLEVAEPLFDKLAATVAPLALFSIGLQLKFNGWKKLSSQIFTSVFYKLLIAPALVLVLILFTNVSGDIAKVSIMEAAMPTVVTSGIIAEQFHLNTKLINLIIGISIVLGFFSTTMWFEILESVF
ncbi:MAG: AEC family transporter [Flavobacteriia bacterium]|nr:AEC family transporter [Flavobacteriia bacterium]OJX39264.1 MAG: transporter [Flavobacteriia bacterium 40-80]